VPVLPRVVIPAVALGLTGLLGVTGCSQFNKALGQQQALISFKDGTPVSVRLQVRSACDKLPNVSAAPIAKSVPIASAVSVIVYQINKAGAADIARLQECLSKFPSVQGINIQDSSQN
jgi:hypothetical protein